MRFWKAPPNQRGRDFIVGDVHGCYEAFMALLDAAAFDPRADRVFSVGDIIDRGPDSEKCLQLLFEHWFFMVAGNHEIMFRNAVINDSRHQTRTDYFSAKNGGIWTKEWFFRKAPELSFWAERIAKLPYVIEVEGKSPTKPFWVVHAELRSNDQVLNESNVTDYLDAASDEQLALMQWGRSLVRGTSVPYASRFPGPIYCGHTPTAAAPLLTAGHINLDGGAGKGFKNLAAKPHLVLHCHTTGKTYRNPL